ncbi:unnamed protein product [Mytilus edulis]|uniref:Uncharacterized protein n=1 Tax=Mytilus edulis TaxID=6550 RepID=A0A8S3UUZ1_MYTED|nr:unnamed protein product [Mytilus edulis]
MHVDDFLWTGSEHFKKHVLCHLRDKFYCGKEQDNSFRYIGQNIQHEGKDINLQQHDYTDELKQVDRADIKNGIYQEIVGQLHWIATQNRPDLRFDVWDLSTSFTASEAKTQSKLNKVRKAKNNSYRIKHPNLESPRNIELILYTDASYANLSDHVSSSGGYVIFLFLASIKESVSLGDITVTWIKTSSQISDCLTEAGADLHPLIKVLGTGKGP